MEYGCAVWSGNNISKLQKLQDRFCRENLSSQLLKMQTTVNISNWGDHSSLSAHGYLLYTVRPMYDPAVFFNTSISAADMQQEVEKPQINLLAM